MASIAAVAMIFSSACASRARAHVPPPSRPARIGTVETGIASWYGNPYHGRRTSSGEIFDMEQLTCAHRTLPFDTWLQVTNLSNHKTVEVRVTDRGPFVDGRIIDLSLRAARDIDIIRSGTARVRLKVIPPPKNVIAETYTVQAGVFSDRERAEKFRGTLPFPDARVVESEGLWKVLVGARLTRTDADELARKVRIAAGDAVVRSDGVVRSSD